MRRIVSAAAALLFAAIGGCGQAPTAPNSVHPWRADEIGPGLGAGHVVEPPTQTTAASFETTVDTDSASRGGPGLGSGH
jgi:hypothetical protein